MSDVEKIIAAFPDWLETKWAEGSLYLTSVYTGARSITCEDVELRDIVRLHVDRSKAKPTLQVFVIAINFQNCNIINLLINYIIG